MKSLLLTIVLTLGGIAAQSQAQAPAGTSSAEAALFAKKSDYGIAPKTKFKLKLYKATVTKNVTSLAGTKTTKVKKAPKGFPNFRKKGTFKIAKNGALTINGTKISIKHLGFLGGIVDYSTINSTKSGFSSYTAKIELDSKGKPKRGVIVITESKSSVTGTTEILATYEFR